MGERETAIAVYSWLPLRFVWWSRDKVRARGGGRDHAQYLRIGAAPPPSVQSTGVDGTIHRASAAAPPRGALLHTEDHTSPLDATHTVVSHRPRGASPSRAVVVSSVCPLKVARHAHTA